MKARAPWSVRGTRPPQTGARYPGVAPIANEPGPATNWPQGYGSPYPSKTYSQPYPGQPAAAMLSEREARDIDAIHRRLDGITATIQRLSQPAQGGDAGHLSDAILRLDKRLLDMSRAPAPPSQSAAQASYHAAEPPRGPAGHQQPAYQPSPPTSPAPFDLAVAEIAARQSQLSAQTPPQLAPQGTFQQPFNIRAAVETRYQPAPAPDLSGLERQLQVLTGQIEAMRRPDNVEQIVTGFRGELAEIRQMLTQALPREALLSLENEIRSLAQRIDRSREAGNDDSTLAGIERALNDIYGTVRTLTPAEQLAGFDESIRSLGSKIDLIVRTSQSADGPGIANGVEQLEGAITALRNIVAHVASNEAVEKLSGEVHALSQRVDQIAHSEEYSGSLTALEQRISLLTNALESRERPAATNSDGQVEAAIHALSDRIDHLQQGNDGPSMLSHLEQRIALLLERIETTQTRPDNSDRLERSLADILGQLEQQRVAFAALSEHQAVSSEDHERTDGIRRELDDLRQGHNQTDQRVQDSLEVLHNTLGHVVDRLASIETDLRAPKSAFGASATERLSPVAAPSITPAMEPDRSSRAAQRAPELPNPVLAQDVLRDVQIATERAVAQAAKPHAAPSLRLDQIAFPPEPMVAPVSAPDLTAMRAPIDASLPPDHPLEPGVRPQAERQSATEQLDTSDVAVTRGSTKPASETSKSDFIAAARRAAATAAAASSANDRAPRGAKRNDAATAQGPAKSSEPSRLTSRIRSLLVGASVVVIVLGTLKMAMNLFEASDVPQQASTLEKSSALTPFTLSTETAQSSSPQSPVPDSSSQSQQLTSTPVQQDAQSGNALAIQAPSAPATSTPATASTNPDVTGSISPTNSASDPSAAQAIDGAVYTDQIPDAIGGTALRTAALKGDPSAAYEIGVRFAEGKGVPANFEQAATWYQRAADKGVVMAAFRLGTLYEKGLGLKKNLDTARSYYVIAADRGNAKAMHNIAVLDADGGGKDPNYKSAAEWFSKAAAHGIADSQYNLGILYARGIGVDQNLGESYKWFSLAAAQGDADAGRKRDDIAKRLDPQLLTAAQLAIQTFMPEPQPADATTVSTPPGGWDGTPPASASAKQGSKPAPNKPAAIKRASK